MYSMVLMMSMAGTGDVASFGGRNNSGCCGTVVVASCGCTGHSRAARHSCGGGNGCGCTGHRHGLFSRRDRGNGCCGATVSSCCPAPACCPTPCCSPCGAAAPCGSPCGGSGAVILAPADSAPAPMVKPNTKSGEKAPQ